MASGQAPEAAAKASVFEDFIDIFTSPAEVFQRRMGASIWVPMLVATVVVIGLFFASRGAMQPVFDAEWARGAAKAMAKNPQITQAIMDQNRPIAEKITVGIVCIIVPLSMLLTGLVLWAVGKIFGAQETPGNAVMVATYAFLPRVISSVATMVMALMMDPANLVGRYSATLSVGHFLDPDKTNGIALAFAGRLDVFILWQTVLLGIGLSVTGKISRQQAFVAAAIVWVIGTLPALLQG